MSADIHQIITDKIITALESAPADGWTCPWHRTGAGGLPRNAATKATYRGINIIALWIAGNAAGYTEPRWATYRQWSAAGAQVRKSEKGTMVVYFKELSDEPDAEKAGEGRRFVARASHVFNIAQVDGADVQELPTNSFDPIEEAERLASGLGVPTEHGGDQACYLPSRDLVRMPPRERFHTRDGYYATLFHELGHATGAKHRLDRDLTGRFGDQAYAMEELVAEITSAFVMAELQLRPEPHSDAVTYLAHWLEVLRRDKRAVFTAAAQAGRAAALITRPSEGGP